MSKLKLGIIMIDEPFYSKDFINQLLNNFEIKYVLLHTEFVSVERIIKTLMIYKPAKFLNTVFKVFKNKINGGVINNILINNKIPILKTNNINSGQVMKFIYSKEVDVLISFNCPQRIKKDLLETPNIFPINIHLGYLPQYRGIFPIFHAFIKGEKYAGVTIHKMNEKFDDGDIIKQVKIPIDENDDLLSLYDKAFTEIPNLTVTVLKEIDSEKINLKRNKLEDSSYFSYPSLRDIVTYRKILKNNGKS